MANSTVYPYGTGGQLPSGIAIVNDFITGGADKALAAEAGKNFYQQVFGTPTEIDLSELTVLSGIIGSNNKWAVGAGGTCLLLPVNPGDVFTIKANDINEANYAFLKQSSMGANASTPQWASGYSGRVILPSGESVEVTAPTDAVTLYIRKTDSGGGNMLPTVYSGIGGLQKEIEELKEKQANSVVAITSEYFNLQGNSSGAIGTVTRATLYMPVNGGCSISIKNKNASTTYLYEVDLCTVSSHTPSETVSTSYTSDSTNTVATEGYAYLIVFFKNGSAGTAAVSISNILNDFDISVIYNESPASIVLKEGEKKWDFYDGLAYDSRKILSDYIAIPRQFMSVRFDMPEWVRVRFRYGLREYSGWTGYYYNGDVVTFERGQSALRTEISFIDGRGINTNVYAREAVGNQMSLTIIDEKDGNVLCRNYDCEKYLGAIRTTPSVSELSTDLPVIVHTSDIHGDAKRFNDVCEYADHLRARILINTGDNAYYTMENGVLFHEKIVFSHKTDFANCIGNHDIYTNDISQIFGKNISPFASEYGYHLSSNNDVTNKCYYYKDLTDCSLRIIAIDNYDGLKYVAYRARISSEQINWFISTLASTPAGYGVLVISHQTPHPLNPVSGKTNFNDVTMPAHQYSIDSDYMSSGKVTGNPFGKIIDAFIGRGTVSGTYTQKSTSGSNETVSYAADFSGLASGVEFIAYINGHTHRDFIGYVSDCEHVQLDLNVINAGPIDQSTGYKTSSDIFRDSAGANQDAFNIYTINRTEKTIGIARIGANLTKELTPRRVMYISYV